MLETHLDNGPRKTSTFSDIRTPTDPFAICDRLDVCILTSWLQSGAFGM